MTSEKNEHIREIEIEGHKFEVDMRSVKKIDSFKIGDRVKVLSKKYSGYETNPGVIVGVDAFKKLPTIVIAVTKNDWGNTNPLEFVYMNAKTEDVEIVHMVEDEVQTAVISIQTSFDRAIAKKMSELREIEQQRDYFLRKYGVAVGVGMSDLAAEPIGGE